MSESSPKKLKVASGDAAGFQPAPDGWDRFERATAAVVKSAEKHKASQPPARRVKKSKPGK